jgi:hypothetical protein
MLNSILKLGALSLLAAAIAGTPATLRAQTTNTPASKKPAKEKKDTATSEKHQKVTPFHGKLAALDDAAKTITVGKRTFHVNSDTRIFKDGQPAVLKDGVVGQQASGGYKTGDDGRLVLTKLNFGKADAKPVEKKKSKTDTTPKADTTPKTDAPAKTDATPNAAK